MAFTFPSWCSNEIHKLVITRDGRMVSHENTHDFDLEIALAEMGAALTHCTWHYQRWLANPLDWVQGPLFNALVFDEYRGKLKSGQRKSQYPIFADILNIHWPPRDFKFLSGLILLDMAQHAVAQLSDDDYDMDVVMRPIRSARKAYSDTKASRDVVFHRACLSEMFNRRGKFYEKKIQKRDAKDKAIVDFVLASTDWASGGYLFFTGARTLDVLYKDFLQLGNAKQQDAWLRRRIARVLQSLTDDQQWPSIS
jgi:hypothetical protein